MEGPEGEGQGHDGIAGVVVIPSGLTEFILERPDAAVCIGDFPSGVLDFIEGVEELEIGQEFGFGFPGKDKGLRFQAAQLRGNDVAQSGGIDHEPSGEALLSVVDSFDNDIPVPIFDSFEGDDGGGVPAEFDGDTDGGGFFAGQVPAGEEVRSGRPLSIGGGRSVIDQGPIDMAAGDDFASGIDKLSLDILGDSSVGEIFDLFFEIFFGDVHIFAGIAELDIGGRALILHFQHFMVEPVASVGRADQIQPAMAVGQAHPDDFIDDVLGLFVEGHFIIDKKVIIMTEKVLAASLGRTGLDDGAVAEGDSGVRCDDRFFNQVAHGR